MLGKIILSLVIVLGGFLFTIDPFLRLVWYSTDVRISEPLRNPNTNRVIVMLVGFQNSGDAVAKTLGPELQKSANVLVVNYPQRGKFTTRKIYDAIMAAIEEHGFEEPSIYGGSMGGLVGRRVALLYKQAGQPFGKIPAMIIDNAQGSTRSVKMPRSALVVGSKLWWMGPMATGIKAPIVRLWVGKAINAVEDPRNRATVTSHYWAMGRCPMPTMAAELGFMLEEDVTRPGEQLTGAVERLIFVTGKDKEGDALVNNVIAIEEWRQAFPELEVAIDENRGPREHNTAAERPRFISEQFAKALAG